MTREEALAAIKLLSALESWAFTTGTSLRNPIPDYLHDDLCLTQKVLENIVLEKPQETYAYATPRLDAMTKGKP